MERCLRKTFMRTIIITQKPILDLLNRKSEISSRQKTISEEMIKLEKEFNTNLSKYQRIDERVRPLINKEVAKIKLETYEEISKVHQDEKDMSWSLEISDRMEEFLEAWKNKNKKK